MKVPRRLVEESELFATLVADAERREPPPEALRGLLRRLETRPAVATASATAGRAKWVRAAIAGAGGVVLLGAFTAELLTGSEPLPVAPPEPTAPAPRHAAPAAPIPRTASEPAKPFRRSRSTIARLEDGRAAPAERSGGADCAVGGAVGAARDRARRPSARGARAR